MTTVQKIDYCSYHSLPFTHICVSRLCSCQIKLCQKCCTQHQKQYQNSNILKIDNYQNKIETQIQIYQKQSQNSQESSKINTNIKQVRQKYEQFSINQINILQQTMKYLNEQGNNVTNQIKQASDNIYDQIITINKRRAQIPQKYAHILLEKNLISTEVQFLTQRGFDLFRKKLDKILIFRKMINDFLQNAQKYGTKYQKFMKVSSKTISNENSMKQTITQILPKCKKIDEKTNTDGNFYHKQNFTDQRANNLIQQNVNILNQPNKDPTRKRRATTIFGKK